MGARCQRLGVRENFCPKRVGLTRMPGRPDAGNHCCEVNWHQDRRGALRHCTRDPWRKLSRVFAEEWGAKFSMFAAGAVAANIEIALRFCHNRLILLVFVAGL